MQKNRQPRDLATLVALPDQAMATEQEAAIFLDWSVRTLQGDRASGRPRVAYHKQGFSIRYAIGDLRQFLAGCRVDGSRAA